MQANLYGTAFPARRAIERQILARVHRLPGSGLPSARLGLEVMTGARGERGAARNSAREREHARRLPSAPVPSGDVESFAFESYLGFPGEKEAGPAGDIHTVMEARLGLSHGPAPSRPLR